MGLLGKNPSVFFMNTRCCREIKSQQKKSKRNNVANRYWQERYWRSWHRDKKIIKEVTVTPVLFFFSSERGNYANPLCKITVVTAESFAVPVLDFFLTPLHGLMSQHVMRDTALEFGLPSGTGKLIPLLLDAGTSSCTRLPPPTDGIFPHLAHSHTCFTAQV